MRRLGAIRRFLLVAALPVPALLAVPVAAQTGTTTPSTPASDAPSTSAVTPATSASTPSSTAAATTRTTVRRRVTRRATTTVAPTTAAPTTAAVIATTTAAPPTTTAPPSSVAPTVATTKVAPAAAEDPAQQRLRWIVDGLVALAVVILVVTMIFWRVTRPPFVDEDGNVIEEPVAGDPEGGRWRHDDSAFDDVAAAAGPTVVVAPSGPAPGVPNGTLGPSAPIGDPAEPPPVRRPVSTVDPWAPVGAASPVPSDPFVSPGGGVALGPDTVIVGAPVPPAPGPDVRRPGHFDAPASVDQDERTPRRRPPQPRPASRGTTPRQPQRPPVAAPPPSTRPDLPPSTSTGFRALGPIPAAPEGDEEG